MNYLKSQWYEFVQYMLIVEQFMRCNALFHKCTFQVLSSNFSEIRNPLLSFQDNIASVCHTSVSASSVYECQQMQLDISQIRRILYDTIFQFEYDIMYNNKCIFQSSQDCTSCCQSLRKYEQGRSICRCREHCICLTTVGYCQITKWLVTDAH